MYIPCTPFQVKNYLILISFCDLYTLILETLAGSFPFSFPFQRGKNKLFQYILDQVVDLDPTEPHFVHLYIPTPNGVRDKPSDPYTLLWFSSRKFYLLDCLVGKETGKEQACKK